MPTTPDRSARIYRLVNAWPRPADISIDLESFPEHGEVSAVLRLAGFDGHEAAHLRTHDPRAIVCSQLRAAVRRLRKRRQVRSEIV